MKISQNSLSYRPVLSRELYRDTTICVLQMEPAKWAGWLVAGSDEMAKLVDGQLHETADWEDNFKALKVRFI